MNGRQAAGLSLFITAIGILTLCGLLVNNLSANALISPSTSQTCSALTSTCVLNTPSGCQVQSSYCDLGQNKIQFLNPCSTWTNLLTLNFVGFVNSFFTNCGQYASQQINTNSSNGQNVVALSLPSPFNTTFSTCTNTAVSISPLGKTTFKCSVVSPNPTQIDGVNSTGPWFFACNQLFLVIGNVTHSVVPSQTSCTVSDSGTPFALSASAQCYLYGVYQASPANVRQSVCATNALNSYASFIGNGAVNAHNVVSGINFGSILAFALSLIGGALVLYLALGYNFSIGGSILSTGGTAGFGSNPQGTKLAQTFGFGLLIFFPLYSEFNTWFSSGYLPYGLDGNVLSGQLGIVSFLIVIMAFVGLYAMSQSGTTGTSG